MGPSMSACLSIAFFVETRQPALPGVIFGTHCCDNGTRDYCWNTCCNSGKRGWFIIEQWPWIPLLSLIQLLHLLFLSSKIDLSPLFLWAVVINEATWWRHRPWCGLKDLRYFSVLYSKEYTFPVSSLFKLWDYVPSSMLSCAGMRTQRKLIFCVNND
jgi:hypothetical protein